MNELLFSVLMATAAVLSFGALMLLGLIAFAGVVRTAGSSWTQRVLCRLSFERLGCCDVAGKAG